MVSMGILRAIIVLICLSMAVPGYADETDTRIIGEINLIRQKYGREPLFDEKEAYLAADSHVRELALRHTLSHWGLDGSRVIDRYRSSGGTGLSAGENLGAGDSIGIILDAWMNSPSHRDNLIDPKWNSVGIGSYQLPGGRIVLVAVFTSSRWTTRSVENPDGHLLLTGEYRRHGPFTAEHIIMTVDGQAITPIEISDDNHSGVRLLRFESAEPDQWQEGRWIPAELAFLQNGVSIQTDFFLIPPPGRRSSP